jgi:hypothetical protein
MQKEGPPSNISIGVLRICTITKQFRNYPGLLIGISILTVSVPLYLICLDLDNARYLCEHQRGNAFPPGIGHFLPGSTFTITCPVSRDIGQDLTFWAQFIASGNGPTDAIPAHVEIRNPNNEVIVDQDYYDDNIVIYVRPEIHGTYTATIKSIEDPDDRVTAGTPVIYYAFGYLAPLTTNAYDEVYNPVGNAIQLTGFLSLPAAFLGLILIGLNIAKMLGRQ